MSIRLTIASACLLAMAAAANADMLWGVNGHPVVSYPGVPIKQQLDFVKDLGMKSYRVDVYNADANTTELLATLVKEGKERGVEILPVIAGAGFDLKKDSADDLYRKAHDVAVALGSRFKDDIRVWELGNEMENHAIIKACEKRDDGTQYPCNWGPAGGISALDYYGPRWAKVSAVLKGLSEGMIEVDPAIRKAMGTAGWGHIGAFERMQQDGIQWDISVWHMYGDDPEWAFEKLVRYGKPIWVTEFNNPYGSQRGETQQAEGLRQAMVRLQGLQRKYKVEAAHVYELLDEKYWAPDYEAFMGLVRLNGKGEQWSAGEPKPAYLAAKQLIRGDRSPAARPQRDCDLADAHAADDLSARKAKFVYCLILGREGDEQGLQKWTTSLRDGSATLSTMVHALMRSDEFNAKYATSSMTDSAYVAFLYRLLVGREPDGYGLDSYVKQIRAGTTERSAVVEGMITSSEFYTHYKAHLEELPAAGRPQRDCDLADAHAADDLSVRKAKFVYCLILGREGNEQEVEQWATSMRNGGASLSTMVHALMRSDEFNAKYATSSMTDEAYITFLYRLLAGREPDQYGLDSYVNQIRAGTTERSAVVEGMITSSEFQAHYKAHLEELPAAGRPQRDCDFADAHAADDLSVRKAKFVYCLILGREGNEQEVETWAASMRNGGASLSNMVHALMRSDEFNAKYATSSMTDEAYITFLYRLLAGREPDQYGLDSYVNQIRAGAMERSAVVDGMITSSEFQDRYVAHLQEVTANSR